MKIKNMRKKKIFLLFGPIIIGMIFSVNLLGNENFEDFESEKKTSQLLISFKKASRNIIYELITDIGGKIDQSYSNSTIIKVSIPEEKIEFLNEKPEIISIEKDAPIWSTDYIPNDAQFSELYGMEKIQAPAAWDLETGSNDITVAILDSGIDINHPDLQNNIWVNPYEIPNNGIDDDGNGYIDDIHGWDFGYGDNTVYDNSDEDSHGTHCAGTIGGIGNNGIGVTGVNWNVKIMSLKFLRYYGEEHSGYTSHAVEAIEYAKNMGVKIISASWGGGSYSESLKTAISNYPGLFIAAAGNSGTDNDVEPHYPSSYQIDNIIAVASTTSTDQLSSFSNYGRYDVDLSAPGSNILSTLPNNNYGRYSGTSMATPHVSGSAALISALYPSFNHIQLKARLLENVDILSSLQGKVFTNGRLNVYKSLINQIDNTPPESPKGIVATAISSDQINLDWNDNIENDLSHYNIYRSMNSGFTPSIENFVDQSISSFYNDLELNSETEYFYKIIAIDTSSNFSPASSEASATTLVTFDGGLITNGDFSDDITAWSANVYGGSATFAVTDGELVTSISYAGTENWNIQIQQQGFTIENNVEYTVSFLARASGVQEIFVGVGEYLGSYVSYGDQAFTLDTTMQAYSFTFTMVQATDTGARIDFNLGLSSVDIIIDNVAIREYSGIDTLAPTISNPTNISYIVSTTGHSITWSASDLNPDTYTITRDGSIIDSGSWSSGNPITINIDGLSADTYTYSIVISDVAGNTASDSVNVEVTSIVNDAPTVSSPSDISYQVSTTGHTISWTATDSNPDTYIITRDGVSIDSGSWSSGNPIIINVDGLSADTYTYTIVVIDTLGLSDSDSVNLVVTSGIVKGGDVWMGDVGTVEPGSNFISTIYVDTGLQDVASYGIRIYFDPTIIQISSVATSDNGFYTTSNINNPEGWVFVTGFDASGKGPSSMQNLFDITWNAFAEGISSIMIDVVDLTDKDTHLIGIPNGIDSEITVGSTFETGDVNHDGSVNIIDALLVAQFYVGEPVSIDEFLADVNLDGAIDIVDALLIAQYYVGQIPELPYT